MYAAAHTSLALAAKRTNPAASLLGLMIATQASELVWVGLTYVGVDHSTVDASGTLHLEYLPFSHSLLVGLGLGALVWGALRRVFRRPQIAAVFGLVTASHIVLDVVQHEPNIRLVPWLASPTLGFNLQASPWLDFALETAFSVACWAYYRGGRSLLVAVVALNIANLPLMLGGEGGASAMAQNRFILPTTILVTIVLAWVVLHRFAGAPASSRRTPAQTPALESADAS
jgi:hypothetical protein